MVCADRLQPLAHDAVREFGFVALAAQVAEIQMTQVGGNNLLGSVGGVGVGKMPVPAKDALLQFPRAARAVLKHLHVVIGFENEDVCVADALDDEFRHVAEVGDDANVARDGAKKKSDRVLRVVRNGKSVHCHVANLKTRTGGEDAGIEFCFERVFGGFERGAVAVNRNFQFRGDAVESLDMVGMFVRDQNAGQTFRRAPDARKPLADLARAQPSVNEDARFGSFEQGAIARRTAGENRKLD